MNYSKEKLVNNIVFYFKVKRIERKRSVQPILKQNHFLDITFSCTNNFLKRNMKNVQNFAKIEYFQLCVY